MLVALAIINRMQQSYQALEKEPHVTCVYLLNVERVSVAVVASRLSRSRLPQ